MTATLDGRHLDVVVIGGSQAGLATSYTLKRRGIEHLVLDEQDRVGDVWRMRWDSLRLFTPVRVSSLPGLPLPGRAGASPTKDEVADYLESYVTRFELPIMTGTHVDRVAAGRDRFEVATEEGTLSADNVVVATGAYHHPRIPGFAKNLDDRILQLHSSQYRRPSQLQDGEALVVGAGNSGAEISLDIVGRHRTWLSGPDTGEDLTRAGSRPDRLIKPIFWPLVHHVLTVNTPIGRKIRDSFLDPPRGIPLGRVRRKDLPAAGIEVVPRTVSVKDGYPMLEDGRVLDVANVIWCTGFVADFSWIDLPIFGDYGLPSHDRGVVESHPGLYFMGLPFQYTISSFLIGGVGRDAEYIVQQITERRRHPSPTLDSQRG